MYLGTAIRVCLWASVAAVTLPVGSYMHDAWGTEPDFDFQRDIRPILSDKCFHCHGPNANDRQAELRLDQREGLFSATESGVIPIVPRDAAQSELIRRITAEDASERMPPDDAAKQLAIDEIERIRQWIEAGAPWEEHWAFVKPELPATPHVRQSSWPRNAIDAFVLAELESRQLAPHEMANRGVLLRRLAFDLTGLPPTPEEVERFLSEDSEQMYEHAVDYYLASTHYGEHRARYWLDAVRYGDTHGLHLDNYREMWLYRDWVVEAFNKNMPYDQFVIEQLAGDLLPDPSIDQLIATGFNRCNVTTHEGGSIEEEVHVRNVVDRVVTTATVLMGLTLDCTRCHDHKYDPLTMQDFYAFSAFLNNLDGSPMDGNVKDHAPAITVPTTEDQQRLDAIDPRMNELESAIHTAAEKIDYQDPKAVDAGERPLAESADVSQSTVVAGRSDFTALPPREYVWLEDQPPASAELTGAWNHVHRPEPVFSGETARVQAGEGTIQHYVIAREQPWIVAEGDMFFCYVLLDEHDRPHQIMLQFNDSSWEHRAYWGESKIHFGTEGTPARVQRGDLPASRVWVRLEVSAEQVGLSPGAQVVGFAFTQFGGKVYWDRTGILTRADPDAYRDSLAQWTLAQRLVRGRGLPDDLRPLFEDPPVSSDESAPTAWSEAAWSESDRLRVRRHFMVQVWNGSRAVFDPLLAELQALRTERESIMARSPTTLVYRERAERIPAYVLLRGQYDQRGDPIAPATPAQLPPMPDDAPSNRLGLAQWLTDGRHPLTARVAVNRLWQEFFGTGIVATTEDFGSQGEVPSHPELLDWLAVTFVDEGWDVKNMIKRIVMSSTYRQSSAVPAELYAQDPANRYLARGPRHRLDAEMIRDQALAVSGLLQRQLGGPGVKPPQPEGIWEAVAYVGSDTMNFAADIEPEKIYRRSVYTFRKRTAPPPQLSMLDAPSRETCTVRRERTNTPLQALMLMNDPQMVAASRQLAREALAAPCATDSERLDWLWQRCTLVHPTEDQRLALEQLLQGQRQQFEHDVARAALVAGMEPPASSEDQATILAGSRDRDVVQLAAWTNVATVVLNADEVLNKN